MESETRNFKNSKEGKIILGQIILLLKNIYFIEMSRDREYWQNLKEIGFRERHSFMVFPSTCSIGLKNRAVEAIEIISEKSVSCFP